MVTKFFRHHLIAQASVMASASKPKSPSFYVAAVLVVILIVVIGGIFYFIEQQPNQPAPAGPVKEPTPSFGGLADERHEANPPEEHLEKGDVGEVAVNEGEGSEPLVSPTMPFSIFSTTGRIVKLNGEKIIIAGSGTNFADGAGREIAAVFLETTLTLTKSPVKYYKGKEGLAKLQKGFTVLVMSRENIRGKTEFSLKAVKVLEQ